MKKSDLKNKKITVMGLGLHGGGVGTAKFLAKQGAQVTVTDLKSEKELAPSLEKLKGLDIKFVLGRHEEKDFKEADLVIKNPGVPSQSPYLETARKNQIPIDTAMGLFFEFCPSKNIIGVTGTKGKSTTTTLIYLILKEENKEVQIAGNIRVSPFEILEKIKKNTPVILELSSWQSEGLALHKVSPHIACITNIYPDHLNRYKSIEEYVEAKKNVFKFQKKDDYVIMNYDSPILRNPRFSLNLKNIYWFSRKQKVSQGSFVKNENIVFLKKGLEHRIISVSDIVLPGKHNLENVLAAVTVACVYGAKRASIQKIIKEFRGLDSRLEEAARHCKVKYYNDTTSTAPISTIAALKSFAPKVILIAGGADKNLDFEELGKIILQKTKALILLAGDATPKLKAAVQTNIKNKKFPIIEVDSMNKAVEKACDLAKAGDIVLLSPACASFGMFQNEFERGEEFVKAVMSLRGCPSEARTTKQSRRI